MRHVLVRLARGIAGALRSHPRVFAGVAAGVVALDILLPPALLSIVHKPLDYFAFNAWLPELPAYVLRHDVSIQQKLEFIPNLALFWVSADSPFGGVDWGFAVTVGDLLRFLLLGLLLGLYFALVLYWRDRVPTAAPGRALSHGGGASGALASVLGISTGGCTVMGCGAPVLPVIGLAFVGLSSTTIKWMSDLSSIGTTAALLGLSAAVLWMGWRVEPSGPTSCLPSRGRSCG